MYWLLDRIFHGRQVSEVVDTQSVRTEYNDGDIEFPDMANETWPYPSNAILGAFVTNAPPFRSGQPQMRDDMLQNVGCRSLFRLSAQGFPWILLLNSYDKEERALTKTVRIIFLREDAIDANIISSHVVYKAKQKDNQTLPLKARVGAHGNEDSAKNDQRSGCSMCASHGMRVPLSDAVVRK